MFLYIFDNEHYCQMIYLVYHMVCANMNTSKDWKLWKKISKIPIRKNFDAALFLYCAVQELQVEKSLK